MVTLEEGVVTETVLNVSAIGIEIMRFDERKLKLISVINVRK